MEAEPIEQGNGDVLPDLDWDVEPSADDLTQIEVQLTETGGAADIVDDRSPVPARDPGGVDLLEPSQGGWILYHPRGSSAAQTHLREHQPT